MNEQQRVEQQEVRDLIAGAGPRAAPPEEDLATIRKAARVEWVEMVRREGGRRRSVRVRGYLALAAGVVLALAVGWWWLGRPAPVDAPVVATVELVAGTARLGDEAELATGGELRAGDTVETGGWLEGTPSGVALRLGGGQSLRLAADSRVRLSSDSRLELERGTLYVDSDAAATSGVEVVTALGTVREIGTQFEVRLGAGETAMRLRVREGRCSLEAAGQSHLAVRGQQISRVSDGSVSTVDVEPYGPDWDWVVATAPSIEIEGLKLSEFLGWVAREIGREVRYASPQLARVAETETVHGTIEGLTPDKALAAVMPGTGFRHQIENGTILITP